MVTNRVGSPVRGQDFYGRDTFVGLVSEKLKTGSVLLAAPRRFGKTSVMYDLIDRPKWDYRVVHADLEHLIEPADLVTLLAVQLATVEDSRIAKIARSLSYYPRSIWAGLTGRLEEIELLKIKVKLREKLRGRWQEAGEELFRRICQSQQTVIFFLDELPMMIDRMARSESHREDAKTMLRWLRSLRSRPETSSHVRFLIAGSIGINQVLSELHETSAINDLEQMRLEPFPPKVASSFVDELATTHGIQLSPASKRKMLHLVGKGVPYFIQVIFSEVAKAFAQDGITITPKRIERIYHDRVLGVDCVTYFEHYYGRLRDYYKPDEEKAAKRILRQLALHGSLSSDTCHQLYRAEAGPHPNVEHFNHLMTDLENDFYVSLISGQKEYTFACKLLRDWWLRHYGMGSEVLE
jgi:hypothetical protein